MVSSWANEQAGWLGESLSRREQACSTPIAETDSVFEVTTQLLHRFWDCGLQNELPFPTGLNHSQRDGC